jgi:hypothetical protein
VADILLKYKRTKEWTLDGNIELNKPDGFVENLCSFVNLDFDHMMWELAMGLKRHQEAKTVDVLRIDREGLPVQPLDSATVELLRSDPKAGIDSMKIPPIRIDLRPKVEDQADVKLVPVPLRAGYDALAEAFGDELYIKLKVENGEAQVECPGCGRWCSLRHDHLYCVNDTCAVGLTEVTICGQKWASVSTKDLLSSECQIFYFPREWNAPAIWITREKLGQSYDQFQKEKSSCSETP